jgi:hypothetical protein
MGRAFMCMSKYFCSVKVKVKFTLEQVTKDKERGSGIALLFP